MVSALPPHWHSAWCLNNSTIVTSYNSYNLSGNWGFSIRSLSFSTNNVFGMDTSSSLKHWFTPQLYQDFTKSFCRAEYHCQDSHIQLASPVSLASWLFDILTSWASNLNNIYTAGSFAHCGTNIRKYRTSLQWNWWQDCCCRKPISSKDQQTWT